MQIKVDNLKKITDSMFSYLRNAGVEHIQIEEDYYWSIPKEARYQMESEPDEFTIGQLSEDWEFLQTNNGENQIGYAFVWLASIFRVVGEKVV